MRSRIAVVAIACTTVVAGSLAVWQAEAEPTAAEIDWKPCPEAEDVECGSVEVPMDWDDPDGETIDIGLSRRKATNPDARIGSILTNPGGPGASGVELVIDGSKITDAVRERFDVVGFDSRGITNSTQVKCDLDVVETATSARTPESEAEFAELKAANAVAHEDCREKTGPLYDNLDNRDVARDMDAVRAALGEKKISIVAYSYSTFMGHQYAELFPDRIRAMVADANMDHSVDSTWDFLSASTAVMEKNFLAFAKWCDTDTECALNGKDTKDVYGQLRDKARDGELTDPETGEAIDFYAFTELAARPYSFHRWVELGETLNALYEGKGRTSIEAEPAGETVNAPVQQTWCHNWDFPVADYADWKGHMDRLAEEFPNVQWSPYSRYALNCVGKPGKSTNPQVPLDIEGAPELLMVAARHDMGSVYPWNKAAAKQSGATLLTYEGYGHVMYGYRDSECINDTVDEYLIDLEVPDGDTSCPGMEESGTDPQTPVDNGPFGFHNG